MPDTPQTEPVQAMQPISGGFPLSTDAGFPLRITDNGSVIVPEITEGQEWPQPSSLG